MIEFKYGWARVGMSILHYFRKKTTLPDLKGSLSSSITPTAIAAANKEVKALLKNSGGNKYGKRGPYNR